MESDLRSGDRVEYIGDPVFDGILTTGDIGTVSRVRDGWVFARWRSGVHSVPLKNVRPADLLPRRAVTQSGNEDVWSLFDHELPTLQDFTKRNPYLHMGSHPDMVTRVWDELGAGLPADCRAQADGCPVLAHPQTDRIFALCHGTAYALWLVPNDFVNALRQGVETRRTWSSGSTTDLSRSAGEGWIWGNWHPDEPEWLRHSYDAMGDEGASRPPRM